MCCAAPMRLRAVVGYGLPAFRGKGAVTPFAGVTTTGPLGRDWSAGALWTRGPADKAIERYWGGPAGQELDSGAQIEKKPDRQIAEWGTEFESVEQAVPGTDRGAGSGQTVEKRDRVSPERETEPEKANEPIEIEMDM